MINASHTTYWEERWQAKISSNRAVIKLGILVVLRTCKTRSINLFCLTAAMMPRGIAIARVRIKDAIASSSVALIRPHNSEDTERWYTKLSCKISLSNIRHTPPILLWPRAIQSKLLPSSEIRSGEISDSASAYLGNRLELVE